MSKRVFAAMSGGVDSAAAALLLLQAGFDVTGVTLRSTASGTGLACAAPQTTSRRPGPWPPLWASPMRCWTCGSCSGKRSWTASPPNMPGAARRIPASTAIGRSNSVPCWTGLWTRGRMPLPPATMPGCGSPPSGRWQLLRGADRRKDQTYFLCQLTQHQLSHLLLPAGDYEKPALRALAAAHGLSNAQKADSQDICFVPDGDYVSFLRQYGGAALIPGDFVDEAGRVLGRHRGLPCYTVGQRKGLGVSAEAPLYRPGKGSGEKRRDPRAGQPPLQPGADGGGIQLALPSRRRPPPFPSPPRPDTARGSPPPRQRSCRTAGSGWSFQEPQRAITPGQAVVLYDGDLVLGGGTIC